MPATEIEAYEDDTRLHFEEIDEDDSEKTHDNPRLTNNTVLSLCYTEWCPELL